MLFLEFKQGDEELEKKFVKEAQEQAMVGLKGHRSVGGLRASIYNAQPLESVKALTAIYERLRKNEWLNIHYFQKRLSCSMSSLMKLKTQKLNIQPLYRWPHPTPKAYLMFELFSLKM